MLSSEQLQAIRERAEAASPGPWEVPRASVIKDENGQADGAVSDLEVYHCRECSATFPLESLPEERALHVLAMHADHWGSDALPRCTAVNRHGVACGAQTLRHCPECRQIFCSWHLDGHVAEAHG